MIEKVQITASIALYNEDFNELQSTINCFLSIPHTKKLFLIDNTKQNKYKGSFNNGDIEYISMAKNIGFGAAHNIILEKIKDYSNYHLILNPDVFFKCEIIDDLIHKLKNDNLLAMIAPKVLFPNGLHQYSCRRYPKVSELLARRFYFLQPLFKQTILKGKYLDKDLTKPFYPNYLTGCFQLYKTEDIVKLGGFDERYFLYMEDVDICRKIDKIGKKKLYYPKVEIVHVLKQGSSKNLKLFLIHTLSAIKYFLKWGF